MKKLVLSMLIATLIAPLSTKQNTRTPKEAALASTKDNRSKTKHLRTNEVPDIAKVEGTKTVLTGKDDVNLTKNQQQELGALGKSVGLGNATATSATLDKIHNDEFNEAQAGNANYSLNK